MADDTPNTPDAPAADATPAPRRRASTRTATPRQTGERKTPGRKPKSVVSRSEGSASSAKEAPVEIEQRAARAVKPRSTKRAAPRPAARTAAAKPSTKTADSKPAKAPRKASGARKAKQQSTLAKATEKVGGRWAAAALAGVAAAGATAAAVLTLRGSSARNLGTEKKPIDITGSGDKGAGHPTDVAGGAHQPDGTNSSASFSAGIADENTIPNKG